MERLRVDLGRIQHVLGSLGAGQPCLRPKRLVLPAQRPFDAIECKGVVVGHSFVPLNRVGQGDFPQRRQIGNAGHGDDIAGRRVVAERQERERALRTPARGDERSKRRVGQAIELASRHVAGARGMVVDRVVQPIDGQQLLAELGIKVLVAHSALGVLLGRGVLVGSLRQDLAFFVETIDSVNALRVHEVRGVPTAGGVEHDVIWAGVRLVVRLRGIDRGQVEREGKTESCQSAHLEEVASHGLAHSKRNSGRLSRYVTTPRHARMV